MLNELGLMTLKLALRMANLKETMIMELYMKSMATALTKILGCLLMIFTIAGCSHKPTISEADTYVQSRTEIAKLDLYKSQIANLKDSLIDIPSNVYSKDQKKRESNVKKLDYYLSNNNCQTAIDFQGCYRETRLLLITTTKELDAANDKINLLDEVIDRMTGNVSSIIDNLNNDKTQQIGIKDKVMGSVTGNTKDLLNKK